MNLLCVVPARGGSKGIPRKNLARYRGRPLIDFTLDAIADAHHELLCVVSTEDEEIRKHCELKGFITDYVRPLELSLDDTPMVAVVLDVLDWHLERSGAAPDYVILLQPTSPLRDAADLDAFLHDLRFKRPSSLVSVHPLRERPEECIRIVASGQWSFLVEPESGSYGRQQYKDDYFFVNGAMYAAQPSFLRLHRSFLPPDGFGIEFFVMAADHGLDIDTPEDLAR